MLHELELTFDIAVQTYEKQPASLTVILEPVENTGAVISSSAKYTMTPRDSKRGCRVIFDAKADGSGIGTTYMGAQRTAKAIGIGTGKIEVIPYRFFRVLSLLLRY